MPLSVAQQVHTHTVAVAGGCGERKDRMCTLKWRERGRGETASDLVRETNLREQNDRGGKEGARETFWAK